MEKAMTTQYQHVLRSAARLAAVSVPPRFTRRTQLRALTAQPSAFRAALSGADSLASSFSRIDRA